MDDESETARETERPQASPQRQRLPLHILLGVIVGVVFAIYLARYFIGDPTPALTKARFDEARERWAKAEIKDYEIEIQVRTLQVENYLVQVRDGQAESAQRNGNPLTQLRTYDTWTVPGMFDTILSDVESVEAESRGDPKALHLLLRAEFDKETGIPLKYRRIERGSPHEVYWEVKRFERRGVGSRQ